MVGIKSITKGITKAVSKTATKAATKVAKTTATKTAAKATTKSNLTKALTKKTTTKAANKTTTSNNIANKLSETTTKKNAVDTVADKTNATIKSEASNTKTNIDDASAKATNAINKNSVVKESAWNAASMAGQGTSTNKAPNTYNRDYATEKANIKESEKVEKAQIKSDNRVEKAQLKAEAGLEKDRIKAENNLSKYKQNQEVKQAQNYVDVDQVKNNRAEYDRANMTGLTWHEKRKYNNAINKETNRNVKLAQAGIDPKSGQLTKPTYGSYPGMGNGTTVINGGGSSDSGFGQVMKWQMIQGGINSGSGMVNNAINTAVEYTQNKQGGSSSTTAPSNQGDNNAGSASSYPDMGPAYTNGDSNQSPSHVTPGGTNINFTYNNIGNSASNNTNHVWSGYPTGSNNNSSNTQTGTGTASASQNRKPSPTNSNDLMVPSTTGTNFSGWLV